MRWGDGRAGAGLLVRVRHLKRVTDDAGRAVFTGLVPDVYGVSVCDPDFVWSRADVELRSGECRTMEFCEPTGWTARALLLDSADRPVPFARVDLDSFAPVEYLRVVRDVQDLAHYTDAHGEIELPRMHHAPVHLKFGYGSRRQGVTIWASDPCATIRLPPP